MTDTKNTVHMKNYWVLLEAIAAGHICDSSLTKRISFNTTNNHLVNANNQSLEGG